MCIEYGTHKIIVFDIKTEVGAVFLENAELLLSNR